MLFYSNFNPDGIKSILARRMADKQSPKPVSVLFVCLGNICKPYSFLTSTCPSPTSIHNLTLSHLGRSTMSEGVFQSLTPSHPLVKTIDSCGTGAYHIGSSPDSRTMSTLKKNNITTYRHKARKFDPKKDFNDFEYILAMDDENLDDLQDLRKREVKKRGSEEGVGRVMLFGEFGKRDTLGNGRGKGEEVQDPYYGGGEGFDVAYEQAVRFTKGFLEQLEKGELS
jgi:low molecular weight phosphotyrosine protein phosphatase